MLPRPLLRWILLGLPLLAMQSCGPSDEQRVAVRGQIRFRGVALNGGAVAFTPDLERGTPNEMAFAAIDSEGKFQLRNDRGQPIAPGWYRVSIVGPQSSPGHGLPEKYRDPGKSGLESKVCPGRENVIDFDLE